MVKQSIYNNTSLQRLSNIRIFDCSVYECYLLPLFFLREALQAINIIGHLIAEVINADLLNTGQSYCLNPVRLCHRPNIIDILIDYLLDPAEYDGGSHSSLVTSTN